MANSTLSNTTVELSGLYIPSLDLTVISPPDIQLQAQYIDDVELIGGE
jgi:hypothetical protein